MRSEEVIVKHFKSADGKLARVREKYLVDGEDKNLLYTATEGDLEVATIAITVDDYNTLLANKKASVEQAKADKRKARGDSQKAAVAELESLGISKQTAKLIVYK